MSSPHLSIQRSLEFPEEVGMILCPACGGAGVQSSGRRNTPCAFSEAGHAWAWSRGVWVSWNHPFSATALFERETRRLVHVVLDGLLFLLAAVGILGLAAAIASATSAGTNPEMLWSTRHPGLLLFWFSLLTDGLLYYRIQRQSEEQKSLPHSPRRSVQAMPETLSWETLVTLLPKDHQEVSEVMSQDALTAVDRAFLLASEHHHAGVETIHLFKTLLSFSSVQLIFGRLGVHPRRLEPSLDRMMDRLSRAPDAGAPKISAALLTVLLESYAQAQVARRPRISVEELLIALGGVESDARELLLENDLSSRKLRNVATWIHVTQDLAQRMRRWSFKAASKPKGAMNRALTARPTPNLDAVSSDLTLQARAGAFFPLIGRQQEMDGLLRVFEEASGNVLLVGESGVGKTALLEGLAERMVAEDIPSGLQDMRLVGVISGAVVAGASGMGTLEERVLTILGEALEAGNVVLAIENLHELVGAGTGGGGEDAANLIADIMSRTGLKVIATTSPEHYRRYLENNTSLVRRFQRIEVEELKGDSAIQVIEAHAGVIEARQQVYFSYDAIEASVQLSGRYLPELYLPSKALDLLEEAAVYGREAREAKTVITKADVAAVLEQRTHIPIHEIGAAEAETLLNLEERMHERMINQEEAVKAVASALRRSREELRDQTRPIANFLFCGPTGVGKTELAKTVAAVYFGDENQLTRMDMSEYQEAVSIERLLGAPGGETGGVLTESLRHRPFTLLLLDELEKAHPDILNVFLQLMDDGRITDVTGRTVDCTQLILIATSNAGTSAIQQMLGEGKPMGEIKTRLINDELPSHFRPEFLNRFDGVMIFTPLAPEHIEAIARLRMKRIADRLAKKGIGFQATDEAVLELAKLGFDPKYGARPLRRVIQDRVDDALARALLRGQIHRRDVVILNAGGELDIQKAKPL